MSTRLRHANSISGRLLRAAASALALMLTLGTAAALHAQQSAAQSAERPLAGTYSLLYSFQCDPDGGYPQSALVRDSSGNLYGTTEAGGQYGYGIVFKVTPSGSETVLHSFTGPPSDGGHPQYGSLTLDAAGNLYGATSYGGRFDYGTVYKVTATGTERVLYNFPGGSDGSTPFGGMARDSAGNLYGTASAGGADYYGIVFKLSPGGRESVLYNFEGSPTDGANPFGNLTKDSLGNLYGTTIAGGASGVGTVFEITGGGTESLLYSFKGAPVDGSGPFGGGLLRDTSGNLYGVTEGGGTEGSGVAFELAAGGTESVLLNFNGGAGGGYPIDGLVRDGAGNLYGSTVYGGSGVDCGSNGCGVLFGLTTAGKEIVLRNFSLSSSSDGAYPYGVLLDPSGNLYGALEDGGAYGCGAVFRFTP
jgi:uncharacterized repeat protein (TIGR03803 family)